MYEHLQSEYRQRGKLKASTIKRHVLSTRIKCWDKRSEKFLCFPGVSGKSLKLLSKKRLNEEDILWNYNSPPLGSLSISLLSCYRAHFNNVFMCLRVNDTTLTSSTNTFQAFDGLRVTIDWIMLGLSANSLVIAGICFWLFFVQSTMSLLKVSNHLQGNTYLLCVIEMHFQ